MGNILQILPMVLRLIQGVEKIIPQSGSGPVKLEVVKTIASTAIPPDQQQVAMQQIEQLVALSVWFMNASQVFKTTNALPSITLPPIFGPAGTTAGRVYPVPDMPAATVDVFDPKLGANSLVQQVAQVAASTQSKVGEVAARFTEA